MEVDFVSFAKLVDSLGGITIDFPHPAFDLNSGLDIREAGPNHLDGPQALSFVRSRHYVEVIDGEEQPDPTADLGRVERQQQFLKAVFSELGSSKNPFTLAQAASATTGGLRIDDTLSLFEAMRFAWRLRSLDPTTRGAAHRVRPERLRLGPVPGSAGGRRGAGPVPLATLSPGRPPPRWP